MEEPTVLIVGGGVSGLTAAVDLAERDIEVLLLEKTASLGGHAAQLSCKATTACVQCGACLVEDKIIKARTNPRIHLLLQDQLLQVNTLDNGAFRVTIESSSDPEASDHAGTPLSREYTVQGIVVATGFEPYEPVHEPYGFKRFPNVITNLALENQFRREGRLIRPSDGLPPNNIAFIQCTGSRNIQRNHPWCSRICCGSSLRLSNLIRYQAPETAVTFFYIDIQNAGKHPTCLMETVETFRYIRTIPGDIFETENNNLMALYSDPETGQSVEGNFDLIVLAIAMAPSPDTQETLSWFGVRPESNLIHDLWQGTVQKTGLPGNVVLSGSTRGPMAISETIAQTRSAVNDLWQHIRNTRLSLPDNLQQEQGGLN